MRTWKEYKDNINIINEQKIVIKTIEGAVDYVLDNSKNKKEAITFIDDSKIDYIKKNSKKIKNMINKLPNSIF